MSARLTPTPVQPVRVAHTISDTLTRGRVHVTFEHGETLELVGTPDEMRGLLGCVGREIASLERELRDAQKAAEEAPMPMASSVPGPRVDEPNQLRPLPDGSAPTPAPTMPRLPSWSGLRAAVTAHRTFDAGRAS